MKRTRLVRIVSTATLAAGIVVAAAPPAFAGYGTCTTWTHSWYVSKYIKLPTIGYNGTSDCIFGYGASSPAVSALQETMNRCYGKSLSVDGIFGTATRNALISVQQAEGVSADGVYGPQTRNALNFAEFWSNNSFAGCEAV